MRDTTQRRGHCPYCGRVQAVLTRTGKMAKHGYTIKYGWFQGVCPGHRHQPMEKDRDITESFIGQVREDVKNFRETIQKFLSGEIHPETVDKIAYSWKGPKIKWEDANDYQKKNAVERITREMEYKAKNGTAFADYLENLLNAVHGHELIVIKK